MIHSCHREQMIGMSSLARTSGDRVPSDGFVQICWQVTSMPGWTNILYKKQEFPCVCHAETTPLNSETRWTVVFKKEN